MLFICLPLGIFAQNDSVTNKSIDSLLVLNDTIKTGKISFSLENHRKGAKTTDKYVFTLLFSQDGDRIKFNITDSMNQKQYVCNGYTVYTIDHKKKKYGVAIASQGRKRKITTISITMLKNLFVDYYVRENVRMHLPKQISHKQLSTNNDTIEISGIMKVSGIHVKNTKDSLATVTEADVKIVLDPENRILKSYTKNLQDKETFKKGIILKSEYTLLSFEINKEYYTKPQHYEGLYYAKYGDLYHTKKYKSFTSENYNFENQAFYNW